MITNQTQYEFGKLSLTLTGGFKSAVGVSRSGSSLSKIIPELKGRKVLDQGSGVGYMSIGALLLGAKKVVATDIIDTETDIRDNLRVNGLSQASLKFKISNLFDNVSGLEKFDVILANLPQHALPAIPKAKKLVGKYGGFDGTDLVCKSLSEAAYYLKAEGRYFGAISELTNFKRTMSIAKSLYDIRICLSEEKTLKKGEMAPLVSDGVLMKHLQKLRSLGLVRYSGGAHNQPVKYKVLFCEFVKK